MEKKFRYNKNQRFLIPPINVSANRDRKGLSTIVVTVILVALSMAAIVLVWSFVQNLIKKQISTSESCFGNSDKVTLNRQYTCYEKVGTAYKLRFSLAVGDVTVNKVIVSVSYGGNIKSYQITNTGQTITNLLMYSGTTPSIIVLPGKNAGLTYVGSGFDSKIDSVQIAPVIGETQCEASDSISEIVDCAFMS
jgi:hypothetical protein